MYAKLNNGIIVKYPYTLSDLRADNPYTSFTQSPTVEELLPFDTVIVNVVQPPMVPYTQSVAEGAPIFNGTTWQQTWNVAPASEQELADRLTFKTAEVRSERNQLLAMSDWSQVADAPVNKEIWAQYRQQLRDVTSQVGFPWEVTWPNKPE